MTRGKRRVGFEKARKSATIYLSPKFALLFVDGEFFSDMEDLAERICQRGSFKIHTPMNTLNLISRLATRRNWWQFGNPWVLVYLRG